MLLTACGSNGSGQLGIGHTSDTSILQSVLFDDSISHLISPACNRDLTSSSTHTLILVDTEIGPLLLGAGTNSCGQLGPKCALWDDVKPQTRFKPVDLLSSLGLKQRDWMPRLVAASWTSSFVVFQSVGGTEGASGGLQAPRELLVACGSNDFGELGHPPDSESHTSQPVIIDLGLKKGERITSLKAGQRHVIAMVEGDGTCRMIGWGSARKGQLDVTQTLGAARSNGKGKGAIRPKTLSPTTILSLQPDQTIVNMSLGASHTLILDSESRLRAFGADDKGQITGLDGMEGVTEIATTWNGSYIKREGKIMSQGSNTNCQLLRSSLAVRAEIHGGGEAIQAGSEHVLLRRKDKVMVGGWNEHGNLGLGDRKDRHELEILPVEGRVERYWAGCATTWVLVSGQLLKTGPR